jgi:dienelactone hydrolase
MSTIMKTEKAKIPSSKGNLAAVIYYSKKKTGKLAILCSGYLDSKDYSHLTGLAETLSKEGYTVVRFDSTGVWESDGNISDYTTTQYLEDIKNVLEYMLQQANYEHILIGGHSRGGQVAILYAARDPRISLVLAVMPSSKLTTKIGKRYKDWQKTGISTSYRDLPDNREQKRVFHVPYSHAVDKDKYDVVKDVKKVKVPIIFIAGELDDQCPQELVKEIFNSANEPKKLALISGIGHNYRFNDDEIKLVNKNILKLIRMMKKI